MSGQAPQSAGKIALTCPYCGFKQLESPYAQSTICRRCGEPYAPGGGNSPILPPPPITVAQTAQPNTVDSPPPEPASSPSAPGSERTSLFSRLNQMILGQKTRDITCFECGANQIVSSASTSSLCPQCGAYIDLTDFKINVPFSRTIQTQGSVTIGPKADVSSTRIACHEAIVQGKLRGNLFCTHTAYISARGNGKDPLRLPGGIEAREIVIDKNSDVEIVHLLKAQNIEISGKAIANLQVNGTVKITKRGQLYGNIHAKSIIIEKGGIFVGDLAIGKPAFPQAQTDSEESGEEKSSTPTDAPSESSAT